MAKKGTFYRDVQRGFGRRLGWKLLDGAEAQLKKRTLDDKSLFRRHMNNLKMPGTFKAGIAKLIQTIDLFEQEYETTKAVFQVSFYYDDDVRAIERKLRNLQLLIENEYHKTAWDRLVVDWNQVLERFTNK